jgi:OTU domain-containing protein 3
MRKDGEWGGNLELQALSLAFNVNITVHQLEAPWFELINFDLGDTRMVHLSYHDGDHYASVRNIGDTGLGPADPIVLARSDAAAPVIQRAAEEEAPACTKEERVVLSATGCRNIDIVREALSDNLNDVDATVEFLVGMRAIGQGVHCCRACFVGPYPER